MKKQLLNESEIRKMMKFANIGALSGGFVERLHEQAEAAPDEEEGGDVDAAGGDELGLDAEAGGEEVEAGGEEVEADEGGEGSEALELTAQLLQNLKDLLAAAGPEGQAASEQISFEGDAAPEGEGEAVADMGDMEDMGGMGDMEDMGGEDPMAMAEGEEDDGEVVSEVELVEDEAMEEEMIAEVSRRVARRLNRILDSRDYI